MSNDKWQLFNEDCKTGLQRIPDGAVDLTVTSPPYDNIRKYNGFNFDFEEIAMQLYRITKPGGVIVWIVSDETRNGSETGSSFKQALYFKALGLKLHDTMIWAKDAPSFPEKARYFQTFEYMFVFSKGTPKTANLLRDRKNIYAGKETHGTFRERDGTLKQRSTTFSGAIAEYGVRFNVWQIPGEKRNKTGHPAVFPQQIARDHILTWSNPGETICDPFSGSGTTAIEAVNNGRRFIGFEISREYYEKSILRIEQETAQCNIYDFLKAGEEAAE